MVFISMMSVISFIFLWLSHPLSMGLMIILQAITIALLSGLMLGSFLFSYIITIVMLSGMLVLFIYMASVASNEKFKTPVMIMISALLIFLTLLFLVHDNNEPSHKMLSNTNMEKMTLTNMLNNKYLVTLIVFYLLFTMITVSSIVNIMEGPLRVNS
uniref:NADH dehydrogenase subunit 6 n=1 Tax=Largus sp. TaxID=2931298 RepID=A0A8T9ZWV3_9HEMI|nr:NADH dehydrogenase subunit 6 [Largus sp.]